MSLASDARKFFADIKESAASSKEYITGNMRVKSNDDVQSVTGKDTAGNEVTVEKRHGETAVWIDNGGAVVVRDGVANAHSGVIWDNHGVNPATATKLQKVVDAAMQDGMVSAAEFSKISSVALDAKSQKTVPFNTSKGDRVLF